MRLATIVPPSPAKPASTGTRPLARSAGIVIVRRGAGEIRYLLLRAYRNWDFPKGLIEEGEAPLDAALREATEETGLTELTFPWGEHFIDTTPYAGGKVARYYLAESTSGQVDLPISPALGRPEHHEFAWLRYADAAKHLVPRLQRVLEWASLIVAEDAAPRE